MMNQSLGFPNIGFVLHSFPYVLQTIKQKWTHLLRNIFTRTFILINLKSGQNRT